MPSPVTLRRVQEIVGRVAELDAIRSWLGASSPPILHLEGEAGIGKTTLWRACVEEAREDGMRVLAASSVQSEAQLSFTTFRDLVDEVFDDVADELPDPQRRALAVTLLREEPEGTPPDRSAVCRGAGRRGPARRAPFERIVEAVEGAAEPKKGEP